ncbi:ion transporter [Flavobacteriaceae bacterium]|nr:ion transporter [Flavobacteriaceae bacterium]MDB2327442.1 ion transporter [Flavobacteriaceae bacterium]
MRNKLNNFLFGNSNFASFFEKSIQVLILISIINFSVQTLPNLSVRLIKILNIVELFSILIFSLEYLLRLFTSPKPFRFFFSFFGLIDLIAILPFYVSLGMDLKSLRAVRLFRLLRLLKFLRYHDTLSNLKQSLDDVKRELFLFSFATVLLIYFSSVGIYFFENEAQPDAFSSIFAAMWWSVATLTTVGYGDIYPITAGGKIFSTFIVFIGLGLVAIPTGIVASSLTKALMKSKD